MRFRGAVQNIAQLRGDVDRRAGEEVSISGNGLAVIGRPPLLAYVVLDDKDTGSRIPLAPGTIISQPFERFWLFHPYLDGGLFRFAVLQGEDWVEIPQVPEPLRYSTTTFYPVHPTAGGGGVSPNQIGALQMLNMPTVRALSAGISIPFSPGLRLARVSLIELFYRAGPRQLTQAAIWMSQGSPLMRPDGEQFGVATTEISSDSRVIAPNVLGTYLLYGQCLFENTGDALNSSYNGHLQVSPLATTQIKRRVSFDTALQPMVSVPVDFVLKPGAALWIIDEPVNGGYEGEVGVNVVWTEENL